MRKLVTDDSPTPLRGFVATYPAPGMIEGIGAGWDFIWIDGQHGQYAYNDLLAMVRACDLVDTASLVRVPWNEQSQIALVADMNASGVIVPCVDSVEEARRAIETAKFPPIGRRSFGGRRPNDIDGRTYGESANDDFKLIVMIESPQAVEQADAIAALPGVDGLFLGPDDVMLRRGHSMTTPRSEETLGEDMQRVSDACRAHGKLSMMVGLSARTMQLCLDKGFGMIVTGYDSLYLREGAAKTRAMEAELLGYPSTSANDSRVF